MKRFEVVVERQLLQAAADFLLALPEDNPDFRIERKQWAHAMKKCAKSTIGKKEIVTFTTSWEEAESIRRFWHRCTERSIGLKVSYAERAFLEFGTKIWVKAHSPRGRRRPYEIDPLEAIDAYLKVGNQQGAVELLRKQMGINDPEEKMVNLRGVQKAIKKGMPVARLIASVEGVVIQNKKKRKPSE